jgi:hypothetical protein
MRGISLLAILVGGVSDIALSVLGGIWLGIYVILSRHVPKDQLPEALTAAINGSTALYGAQLAIGFLCSVAGGFIAASLSKQRRLLNGILASWLCLGTGIYAAFSGHGTSAVWLEVVSIVLTPMCYLLGARLRLGKFTGNPAT